MSRKRDDELLTLTRELTRSFERWEYIKEYGCSDPFWGDGVNMNLVRNHIISYKRQINEILREEHENSLFSTPYPDVYYRETPPEVSNKYMAREDEIRARAAEQMALYEQNPDYLYIRDNCEVAFPNGETKATKAAGIYPRKYFHIRHFKACIECDDLVQMRSYFSPSYEKQAAMWAEQAKELRAFMEANRLSEDNIPVTDDYYLDDEEISIEAETVRENDFKPYSVNEISSAKKQSLDSIINSAKERVSEKPENVREIEQQLSLF